MTQIEIPDSALEELVLSSESRTVLGAANLAEDRQADRVSLGRPVAMPLDPAVLAGDAQSFLASRPDSRFWLLALTCSFRDVPDAPIESAFLEVSLESTAPAGAAEPTAWSMEPQTLATAVTLSRTLKLDASLKLSSEAVPVEVGPSAGVGTTTSFERSVAYLQAYREGTARPAWFFTRTPAASVSGVHRLRAVVEVPAGAAARARVGMGATLRLKRLGIIPYRAELDQRPEVAETALPAR